MSILSPDGSSFNTVPSRTSGNLFAIYVTPMLTVPDLVVIEKAKAVSVTDTVPALPNMFKVFTIGIEGAVLNQEVPLNVHDFVPTV